MLNTVMGGRRTSQILAILFWLWSLGRAGGALSELPTGYQARMEALLPLPNQSVQLLKRQARLAVIELQDKVIRENGNPEVLRRTLSEIASGASPIYDERLGISRDEFEHYRYLVFHPVLEPYGKAFKLPLSRNSNRLTFGDTPELAGLLKGVSIDLRTGQLSVPEGFSFPPTVLRLNTSSAQNSTYSGFQWKMLAMNPANQNGIKGQFNLYHSSNGQIILNYKQLSMVKGIMPLQESEIILVYTR